jgi:hypothetical protein
MEYEMKKLTWVMAVFLAVFVFAIWLSGRELIGYQTLKITNEEWPGNETGFSVGADACYFGVQYGVYHGIVHAELFASCAPEAPVIVPAPEQKPEDPPEYFYPPPLTDEIY